MGAWGILALMGAALLVWYFLACRAALDHIVDDDGEWFAAVEDDRQLPGDGIDWHPPYVLPEAKGQYWTRHPEAPNHVFEGTRWNGSMWISEDGHPCYFQMREWAYPVEEKVAA